MTEKKNLQPTETIAKLFGVTVRQVQKLAKNGTLPTVSRRPYQFDLLPTIQAYINWLQERIDEKERSEEYSQAEYDKIKADAGIKASRAKLTEMQLKELEGKMHRSEDVKAMTEDLLLVIEEKVRQMPGRITDKIEGVRNAGEVSIIIQEACHNVLNELAAYKFDPEAAEQRRRDHDQIGDNVRALDGDPDRC